MTQESSFTDRFTDLLWGRELSRIPGWQRRLLWFARLIYALVRDLTQANLSLHAMSLVYTTLLSLVPLLAVSFSVLKGFGVHNQLEPFLLNALAPLGESGHEITTRIISFVDNMQVGVLGSVGLAMLLYTVISLIQKIEQAFNYTWRVTQIRPMVQRFTQYLSVLLVGPVLFVSALGVSASLGSNHLVQSMLEVEPLGHLIRVVRVIGPYLMISLTFTFFYLFVPNTRVKIGSALVGALAAGLLWELVGDIFATFIGGSTQYTAIYSSLAIIILLMIWTYLGWLILLLGASIAFYHQHPEYLTSRTRDFQLSNRLRERLALGLAATIAQRYLRGENPWNADQLARHLGAPTRSAQTYLDILQRSGWIVATAQEPPGYVPRRTPQSIRLKELLDSMRQYEEREYGYRYPLATGALAQLEQRLDEATGAALADLTLEDLAMEPEEGPPAPTTEQKAQQVGVLQGSE